MPRPLTFPTLIIWSTSRSTCKQTSVASAIASCVASYVFAPIPWHGVLGRLTFACHSQEPPRRESTTRDPNWREFISFPSRTRVSALRVTVLSGSSWTVTAMPIPSKSNGARAARTFVLGQLLEKRGWGRNAFAVGTVYGTGMPLERRSRSFLQRVLLTERHRAKEKGTKAPASTTSQPNQ